MGALGLDADIGALGEEPHEQLKAAMRIVQAERCVLLNLKGRYDMHRCKNLKWLIKSAHMLHQIGVFLKHISLM